MMSRLGRRSGHRASRVVGRAEARIAEEGLRRPPSGRSPLATHRGAVRGLRRSRRELSLVSLGKLLLVAAELEEQLICAALSIRVVFLGDVPAEEGVDALVLLLVELRDVAP